MSTTHRSRLWCLGTAVVFALTLLAPVAVNAEEEFAALAPAAAPSVDETSADEVRAARALAAEQALQSGDIGSMQEEHLYAIVAASSSWDETSGYRSVEASRAAIGHPTASTNDALPAALERGTRAESAVLWSILHQDDAVSVNPSDDRIAAALFDDEPSGGEDATVAVLHRTQR
jgi:hypothetical protein